MSRDEAALFDIERALRLIIDFTVDSDSLTFFEDLKTQSAVLH